MDGVRIYYLRVVTTGTHDRSKPGNLVSLKTGRKGKGKKVRIPVKTPQELHDKFQIVAGLKYTTMSDILRDYMTKLVEEYERKKPEAFAHFNKGRESVKQRA